MQFSVTELEAVAWLSASGLGQIRGPTRSQLHSLDIMQKSKHTDEVNPALSARTVPSCPSSASQCIAGSTQPDMARALQKGGLSAQVLKPFQRAKPQQK